jgi:hypothetical protein
MSANTPDHRDRVWQEQRSDHSDHPSRAAASAPRHAPLPTVTSHHDHQDVVNRLLAAAIQTRATLDSVLHAAAVSPADQPQAAADLADAATALTRVHDALMHAANSGQ